MLKISREIQRKSERDGVPEKEGFMSRFKRDMGMMLVGLALSAMLTGGAVAAGITAEPAWSPIYVDGRQVQMTAYNILGNNYVKLRDIGQAVGFNVYYQNGVQVDSDAPYTGEAPAQPAAAEPIRVGSYKGNTLKTNDRSGLIIGPSGRSYTVTSSNPAVVAIENVSGNWVAVTKAPGSAVITASDGAGGTGRLTLTVEGAVGNVETPASSGADLTANMEARQEMIRLINQVRRENGVGELTVNDALMNAAQAHSTRQYSDHHIREECEAALTHGYPYGFGSNLTAFTSVDLTEIPQRAVRNWVNSPGHFQTMTAPYYDSIGVGITVADGWTYCYMFVGDPNSHNAYE